MSKIDGPSQESISIAGTLAETQTDKIADTIAKQVEATKMFQEGLQTEANPAAARFIQRQKKVESPKTRIQKMMASGEKGARLLPIEQIKDQANQFQQRNRELLADTLTRLRLSIKPGDSKEDILKKIRQEYPYDPSLADEALEFLLETTEGELFLEIQSARNDLNEEQGREIRAGRNIHVQAWAASDKGLGSPTQLRDLYRDITGNPREPPVLFDELSRKYPFQNLQTVIKFLLHSLGADHKSKGPSIERGELTRLITETRSLQAILGVYRFFRSRQPLLLKLFTKAGISFPENLNFETMAKEFMALVQDRYPSSERVKERSSRLGLEESLHGKIYTVTQFRDACREVAKDQIFRNLQHRDDLYMAFLEFLEECEDSIEELVNEDNTGVEESTESQKEEFKKTLDNLKAEGG